LVAALALAGCAILDPFADNSRVNDAWGRTHAAQIGEQTADPTAPHSQNGPMGLDAPTSERVAERYYQGQESQTTRKARSVTIGEIR
jgi:hypothetical protein